MNEKAERRAASRAYKAQEDIGGIYRVVHQSGAWQSEAKATPNLQGEQNKLRFSLNTRVPLTPEQGEIWAKYNYEGFELVVLEQLKRKPDQSTAEFREDLKTLLEMWENA